MKIKCIDKSHCSWLTIGKIYNVIDENEYKYLIICDENEELWYRKIHFKPLSEIRNNKIDKLLE
jgi:hypothetical protein